MQRATELLCGFAGVYTFYYTNGERWCAYRSVSDAPRADARHVELPEGGDLSAISDLTEIIDHGASEVVADPAEGAVIPVSCPLCRTTSSLSLTKMLPRVSGLNQRCAVCLDPEASGSIYWPGCGHVVGCAQCESELLQPPSSGPLADFDETLAEDDGDDLIVYAAHRPRYNFDALFGD